MSKGLPPISRIPRQTRVNVVRVLRMALVAALGAASLTGPTSALGAARSLTNFTETFTSTGFKDTGASTADWNTALGQLQLPTGTPGWYNAANTVPSPDQLTDGTGTVATVRFALALGQADRPVITWVSDLAGTPEVHVARWTGTTWTGFYNVDPDANPATYESDNVSVSPAVSSFFPALTLDSQGRPIIVWCEFGDTRVTHWTGTTWTGYYNVDPDVNPATFENDSVSGPFGGTYLDQVAVNSLDRPAIAWLGEPMGTRQVHYSQWNGVTWTDASGVDTDSNPATFELSEITQSSPSHKESIAMAFDTSNRPMVAWSDKAPGNYDVFFSRWNGVTWTDASLVDADSNPATYESDNVSLTPSRDVNYITVRSDSAGKPAVSWQGLLTPGPERDLFFSKWNGSTWTGANGVDADSNPATFESIQVNGYGPGAVDLSDMVLDSANNPALVWSEADLPTAGATSLLFSRWNGSTFTGATGIDADSNPVTFENSTIRASGAFNPSLSLDSAGQPAAAWTELTGGGMPPLLDIKFAHWMYPRLSPRVAQSTTVDTESDRINSATLTVNAQLNGGLILYELSVDGGNQWEAVTPGVPHVFVGIGSDLRWRATLIGDTNELNATPVIQDLTLAYSAGTPTLVRITGDNAEQAAVAVSKQRFPLAGSASCGVVARRDVLVDAFVTGPLANLARCTLLLTPTDSFAAESSAELNRALNSTTKAIFIAGGTHAVGGQVEDALHASGYNDIRRLAGDNRRSTAKLVSYEVTARNAKPTNTMFLSEDTALVDALAISAAAGRHQDNVVEPILVTKRRSGTLDANVKNFLAANPGIVNVDIIGGTTALPTKLEDALHSLGRNTTRLAGPDRFSTNRAIVDGFFSAPASIVVANGEPSGIAGARSMSGALSLSAAQVQAQATATMTASALLAGIYAADIEAPLVLTRTQDLPSVLRDYLVAHSGTIGIAYIVGSTDNVSTAVENDILGAI